MRRKVFFLPSMITAFGLSCGLFAIFRVSLIPQGMVNEKVLTLLVAILLLAAIADILDGAVARAMKVESEFGGLFDSLADSISFGVAPSLIIVKSIPSSAEGQLPLPIIGAAMVYALCGVLRLVRFNVQMNAAKEHQEEVLAQKKNFTGLPIPAACAAAISVNLLLHAESFTYFVSFSSGTIFWVLAVQMVLLGYLMISRWKFPSIKTLRIPVGSFQLVFITVLAALFILYGLVHHTAFVLFIASWGYIFVSLILSIIRLFLAKRTKVLEEFDLDEDDINF